MKSIFILSTVFAIKLSNPNGEPTAEEIENSRKFDENSDEAAGSVEFDRIMSADYRRDMSTWNAERK